MRLLPVALLRLLFGGWPRLNRLKAQPLFRLSPVVGARSGIAKTGKRPARQNIDTLWSQRGEHWYDKKS